MLEHEVAGDIKISSQTGHPYRNSCSTFSFISQLNANLYFPVLSGVLISCNIKSCSVPLKKPLPTATQGFLLSPSPPASLYALSTGLTFLYSAFPPQPPALGTGISHCSSSSPKQLLYVTHQWHAPYQALQGFAQECDAQGPVSQRPSPTAASHSDPAHWSLHHLQQLFEPL